MIRTARLQGDTGGERCGNADARIENADDEGIAGLDDFDPTADADAEHFEPLNFFAGGVEAPYDGTGPGGKTVEREFAVLARNGNCHRVRIRAGVKSDSPSFGDFLSNFGRSGVKDQFHGGIHGHGDSFGCHRAGTFLETELMQFQVAKMLETGEFKGAFRAVHRAAVNDQDLVGAFGPGDHPLDAAADAGEAGHIGDFCLREPPGGAVGEFSGVGTPGAGINDSGFSDDGGRTRSLVGITG